MNQDIITFFYCCVIINIILLCVLSRTSLCAYVDPHYLACEPQTCGNQSIRYPFYIQGKQQPFCGYPGFAISCAGDIHGFPTLNLSNTPYIIHQIFYHNESLRVSNAAFSSNTSCISPTHNLTLPPTRTFTFLNQNHNKDILLFFGCNLSSMPTELMDYRIGCSGASNKTGGSVLALYKDDVNTVTSVSKSCGSGGEVVDAVVEGSEGGMEEELRRGFMLNWTASDCKLCNSTGGRCGFNSTILTFQCYCTDRIHASKCDITGKKDLSKKAKLGLGLGIGFLGILIIGLLLLFRIYKRKRVNSGSSHFESRYSYSDSSSNPHLDNGAAYLGVPLFSYKDLKEATNNFDHNKELGDGGFGTVYYGKLQDGREVAVKRLYEHNYRRVEQFINEVQILTRLRHKNLVSLYGCTSRHSRELLLVYEYISNGTVACHLHGESAKRSLLPWSTRIKIAIETATALAYLHASDIIHRDVKTNNILLDHNFTVKVADFGLSRLFPMDATHVSTAPQGTPGYVDPEYHQNYQLTSKSDVYSFGVVLIELISSMPAVDMNRDKDEINLSNLAMKKIQNSAIIDLVDRSLGFDSDNKVRRMIVSVAELAFQCLQRDKELRPSMDEVLDELKKIESGKDHAELQEEADVDGNEVSHNKIVHSLPPPSPEWDEVGLLKHMKIPPSSSPITVTDNWESKCTTPSISA
ncbi:LEAF RUST 10 DISEASE-RESISTANCEUS RECEPTOR-LIKE PROTEIN KINASE-like 1.2 isoform X2 [Arachis hypogaea]|uniref:LEAF RUST 10 DISEASE-RESISTANCEUS RECEPTOR-LIKE PROTEIN KINASE-like 1.2 isoform X2 n=2 Tax=Arachis hypogaea TaxID=3818 RepID=UPI000DEC23B8|nr:LEAF RUST 10 DISEASE-RESISTANCE LOCUS RECEPTOR-LIKE PROTEIN KINASE-like 1.2 isoform X7 [Arachis hypogaea]QHO36065.1 putative serine/threonine-protein kinase [Arachis hypogaea]